MPAVMEVRVVRDEEEVMWVQLREVIRVELGEAMVGSGEIWTIFKRVLQILKIVKRVLRQLTAGHRNIEKSQALKRSTRL